MAEPSRRTLQHPLAFWAVLAVVAALGIGVAAGLALQSQPPRPIVVAG